MREFDRRGGDAVTVRVVEVEPFSEQAEDARAFGIEPREVVTVRDGRATTDSVFLGLVVSGPGDEVVVPFVGPGALPEYELTRSVRTVTAEGRLDPRRAADGREPDRRRAGLAGRHRTGAAI